MLEILKYNNFVFVSGFNFSLLSLCPFDQKAQSETHCPTPALVFPTPPLPPFRILATPLGF